MNTKQQAQHTPTPWHVKPIGSQRYVEAPDKMICDMQRDACLDEAEIAEQDANAAFIVRACNAHEELVEALKQIACDDRTPSNVAAIARNAIAKAGG